METTTPNNFVFDNVTLIYAGHKDKSVAALDGVSFEVREAEFVCLMGPSGCGKTTLLNIAAGFLRADSGLVSVGGSPIHGPSSDRAVVFQEYALFPWKSAIENVAFGLKAKGMNRTQRERKALEFLRLVGLRESENALPNELSGGMRQRVALARALAVEPEILLMDEPLGALDAQTRELLQEELNIILEAQCKTTLMVTHSVDEAIYLSDRIVILTARPGKIAEIRLVPLPRPRYPEMRHSDEYLAIKTEVASLLRSLYNISRSPN